MKEFLATIMVQAAPMAGGPPKRCELVNDVKAGASNIVGNVIGLADLAPWIIGILVVIAILVAAIPKLRSAVVGNLMWVVGIAIVGTILVGGVLLFVPSSC